MNRRFVPDDLIEIARLSAKRHSEAQACKLLGINHKSFANWKCRNRNSESFNEHLTHARAIQFESHITNIEDAERGDNGHKMDWRASKALIELKFPELLPQAGLPAINVRVVDISSMRRAYDAPPRALDDVNRQDDSKVVSECQISDTTQIKAIQAPERGIVKSKILPNKA